MKTKEKQFNTRIPEPMLKAVNVAAAITEISKQDIAADALRVLFGSNDPGLEARIKTYRAAARVAMQGEPLPFNSLRNASERIDLCPV